MKIRRKALTLQAWHNTKGKAVNGKPAETMPIWLQRIAEPAAKPDTTFQITVGEAKILVHAGDVVYQTPDGSVHSVNLTRFRQEYDLVDVAPTSPKDSTPVDPATPSEEEA